MTEQPVRELVIEAGHTEGRYWRDVWQFRDLFVFLAWRDILVRYKQTVFGVAWAWLRPVMTMVVFTFVFGKLAKLPSGNTPYPILVFIGQLPWQFFSTAFAAAATSMVENAHLISKIYFPRVIVPVAAVIVCFVDFLVAAILLVAMMAWYGVMPDWRIVTLPFFIALAFLLAVGLGLWLAALNVKYRDFRFVVPFMAQLGLYVSPVGFSSTIVPEKWRLLYDLNPMAGVIEGCRWALLRGDAPLDTGAVLLACAATAIVLAIGVRHFRKTERTFADLI